MTIHVAVVADSVSPAGARITTFQLRYPRFIHAEFMTHRMFSRNARSSRAMPIEQAVEMVRTDPAMPERWGRNGKGMQDHGLLYLSDETFARSTWKGAALTAATRAESLLERGVHKQIVNRILEPFLHIDVVVTATEWEGFYAQRLHPDAQPEMQILAQRMWHAHEASEPVEREIHTPYVEEPTSTNDPRVSVARCARVSYRPFGERDENFEADLALFAKLRDADPWHASPFEHVAFAEPRSRAPRANFHGWKSLRYRLERRP